MNDDADFLGNKRSDYIVEQTVDKNVIMLHGLEYTMSFTNSVRINVNAAERFNEV